MYICGRSRAVFAKKCRSGENRELQWKFANSILQSRPSMYAKLPNSQTSAVRSLLIRDSLLSNNHNFELERRPETLLYHYFLSFFIPFHFRNNTTLAASGYCRVFPEKTGRLFMGLNEVSTGILCEM